MACENFIFSKFYYFSLRKHLPKYNITLVTHDCVGGVIYHQIGKQFASPLINTLLSGEDFIKLCSNFRKYMESELLEFKTNKYYPVGILKPDHLDPIIINFVHDKDFNECKKHWDVRKSRIDYEKIVYIFNLTNLLDDEKVLKRSREFNGLNIQNKMIFTQKYLGEPNTFVFNFRKKFFNSILIQPKNINRPYKKFIDDLDYSIYFSFFR